MARGGWALAHTIRRGQGQAALSSQREVGSPTEKLPSRPCASFSQRRRGQGGVGIGDTNALFFLSRGRLHPFKLQQLIIQSCKTIQRKKRTFLLCENPGFSVGCSQSIVSKTKPVHEKVAPGQGLWGVRNNGDGHVGGQLQGGQRPLASRPDAIGGIPPRRNHGPDW